MELQNEIIMPECTLCISIGRKSKMKFFAINLEYMVLACEEKSCTYPIGCKDIPLIKTSNLSKYKEILKLKEKISNNDSTSSESQDNYLQKDITDTSMSNSKKNTSEKLSLSVLKNHNINKSKILHRNIESNVNSIKGMMEKKSENFINNPKMLKAMQILQSKKNLGNLPSKTSLQCWNLKNKSIEDANNVSSTTAKINLDFQNNACLNRAVLPIINLSQDVDGSFKFNVKLDVNSDTNIVNENSLISDKEQSNNDSVINVIDKNRPDDKSDSNIVNETNNIIYNNSDKIFSTNITVEKQPTELGKSETVAESLSSDLMKDLDLDNIDINLNDDFIESLLT